MSGGDPPIIISGGSITINFDESQVPRQGDGKFINPNKRIKRVEVTGDGIDFEQNVVNGKVTIKIYYGDSWP